MCGLYLCHTDPCKSGVDSNMNYALNKRSGLLKYADHVLDHLKTEVKSRRYHKRCSRLVDWVCIRRCVLCRSCEHPISITEWSPVQVLCEASPTWARRNRRFSSQHWSLQWDYCQWHREHKQLAYSTWGIVQTDQRIRLSYEHWFTKEIFWYLLANR